MLSPRILCYSFEVRICTQAKIVRLKIESLAYGGKGVGRLDGKVYFVPNTVEEDLVEAEVRTDKGRYSEARLLEILEASPYRSSSPCEQATKCGGCQWLEIDYSKQLEWKKSFVTSALRRIGKLEQNDDIEIIPSPRRLHYRNRILLRCAIEADPEPTLKIGYFERGSRDFVPIKRCEIAREEINRYLTEMQSLNLKNISAQKFRIELQLIPAFPQETSSGKTAILATIFPAEGQSQELNQFIEQLNSIKETIWAGLIFDVYKAPFFPFETVSQNNREIQLHTAPNVFQQVNVDNNRILRKLVTKYVNSINPMRVLDCFCGSGNLSIGLANRNRYIEGIESNELSIKCANFNVRQNKLEGFNYLCGDTEAHLWKCSKKEEDFDLVITDPPRQGMYKGIIPLSKIAPHHIIYVSCDPTTLARDIGALSKKGYKIRNITAFDFFPNSFHVESIVFLEKK